MKKLTRLQKFVIIMAILVVGIHVAPIASANPITAPIIKEGMKHFDHFVKILTKIFKSGEIKEAHKNLEKAFQKIKEHPVAYGLAAAEVVDGAVTITEVVDSKEYNVKLEINDDNQCLDVYVKGELVGAIAYNQLVNQDEDEVNRILEISKSNAITIYERMP